MEVKDLKKLFGNYTQFTKESKEYKYGYGNGNKRGLGNIYFPINGVDCSSATWLELYDPKTSDLSWISDVFPNLKVLELAENKTKKLQSLDGIEKLSNLETLISNSQFDIEGNLKINSLGTTVRELYLWYTNLDLKILNQNMNFIYLHGTKVSNIEKLRDINLNYLKTYKLKDSEGNNLGIEDFSGEFKDFIL